MNKLFNTAFEITITFFILLTVVLAVSFFKGIVSESLIFLWEICGFGFILLAIFKNYNK